MERLDLVKEGVEYYNKLTPFKKKALPYFPIGFTHMEERTVASGLICEKSIRLAVYNLGGELQKRIPLKGLIAKVKGGYPSSTEVKVSFDKEVLIVDFTKERQAVFVEVELI